MSLAKSYFDNIYNTCYLHKSIYFLKSYSFAAMLLKIFSLSISGLLLARREIDFNN